MVQLAGLLIVLIMVFGGFLLSGGSGEILLAAAPMEFLIIAGAGAGTLLLANSPEVARATLGAPWRVFAGPRWRRADYAALARLLATLLSMARRRGVFAIEADIEAPGDSALFRTAPALLADADVREALCDILRRVGAGRLTPEAAGTLLQRRIEAAHAVRLRPASALERLADALPALGIVAAVLGVINSMAAIDQSTAVLGKMIASAMVGTLLGVLLAYGVVGPLAARLAEIEEDDLVALDILADALIAWLEGESAEAAVETGLSRLPAPLRPEWRDASLLPFPGAARVKAG